jgi:3',5'-cyclic AMP phosphodiesterase CpdA
VVISGDLTQRATDEEYQKGAAFLQRVAWPNIIIPGNHDLSATDLIDRFTAPWDKWRQYVHPETEPVLHANGYSLVGVNTARAAGWYFDWSRGQINQTQIKQVQSTLQAVPAQNLRIVIAHHPFWLPEQAEYRDVVTGRDKAMEGFKQADVDMILSGHIHMAYTHILQGIIISHAGTTFSNRLLEGHPNSFNVIRGNREHLTIEFMEWNGQQFHLVEQQAFKKTGGAWQSSP